MSAQWWAVGCVSSGNYFVKRARQCSAAQRRDNIVVDGGAVSPDGGRGTAKSEVRYPIACRRRYASRLPGKKSTRAVPEHARNQRLWAYREHNVQLLLQNGFNSTRGFQEQCTHWAANHQYSGICGGRIYATAAAGRAGRTVRRRSGPGPWLSKPARSDGREVYAKPV